MTLIISIQGNIGSGKSSFLNKLQELYSSNNTLFNNKKICFLQEPVNEWESLKDENNKSLLELYYLDQNKYSFAFQIMAFMSRVKQLKAALANNYDLIISERSLKADHEVFTKMLYDEKKIKDIEYKIYLKWVEEFFINIPPEYVVYIQTTPVIAYERIISRDRTGEKISLNYIKDCHNYHERWINNLSLFCLLDGNNNINKVFNKWVNKIDKYIDFILTKKVKSNSIYLH